MVVLNGETGKNWKGILNVLADRKVDNRRDLSLFCFVTFLVVCVACYTDDSSSWLHDSRPSASS